MRRILLLAALLALAGSPAASATVPRVRDARITESSGLAPSLRHDGVLWTHNDSGNPPRLYGLDPDGRTAATLRVRGAADVDWEAIASLRTSDGTAWLAIGDIGDNTVSRDRVEVDLVREPARLEDADVPVQHRLLLRYPQGRADAEVLLAHPRTGRLFVVTKTLLGARLYAVPASAWPGSGPPRAGTVRADLRLVAEVPAVLATDGAFLPDGRIVLRSYTTVEVYPGPEGERGGRLEPQATLLAPQQPQGESLAVVAGGAAVLLGSEGRDQPLRRVRLPRTGGPDQPPASTAASASAAPEPGPETVPQPAGERLPSGVLAGVGAAVLAMVALGAARRRRR